MFLIKNKEHAMDEFDKIRELTEDLTNRKEPTFTGFNFSKEPTFQNKNIQGGGENENASTLSAQTLNLNESTSYSTSHQSMGEAVSAFDTSYQTQMAQQTPVVETEVNNQMAQMQMSQAQMQMYQTQMAQQTYMSQSARGQTQPTQVGQPQQRQSSQIETRENVVNSMENEAKPSVNLSALTVDDGDGFDSGETAVEEKELTNMRFHVIFIALLGVVLVSSLFGFYLFYKEADDFDEIATITASQEMVKEMPEQSGGIAIPDQDKLVYNRIRTDNVTTKVESLFPEPERPVMPQILAIEQNAPEQGFVAMNEVEAVDPLKETPKSLSPVVVNEVVAPVVEARVDLEPQIVEKPKLPPQELVKEEPVLPQKPKKEVITLEKGVLPVQKVVKAPVENEVWRVQLFASNNKEAVEKAWRRIEKQHAKLLSNMSYLIKKVDIKGKGAFYRLQVGQFPTREMADGLCTKLKAKRQDCIPTK